MRPKVIIDNGHGYNTPGKSSPDGLYHEWEWTRHAARGLKTELERRGLSAHLLVPEDIDISLTQRCVRANKVYANNKDAVLISLHSNAAGDGRAWGNASGWSAWVARNASETSRRLAALLNYEASRRGLSGNRSIPPCGYLTLNAAICRGTLCPAVLTENMFHDNHGDVDFLLSDKGLRMIIELHADALCRYYKEGRNVG